LGGAGQQESSRSSVARVVRAALCILLFVLCILLIGIVVVPVPFVCCSVKLPLPRPTSFCLFLSILLPTPAGVGVAEQLSGPFVAGHSPIITGMLGLQYLLVQKLTGDNTDWKIFLL